MPDKDGRTQIVLHCATTDDALRSLKAMEQRLLEDGWRLDTTTLSEKRGALNRSVPFERAMWCDHHDLPRRINDRLWADVPHLGFGAMPSAACHRVSCLAPQRDHGWEASAAAGARRRNSNSR
jgi:hypothetical protein